MSDQQQTTPVEDQDVIRDESPVDTVEDSTALTDEEVAERAGTIVLPYYEDQIREASSRGSNDDIADIMEEYSSKREERARKLIERERAEEAE